MPRAISSRTSPIPPGAGIYWFGRRGRQWGDPDDEGLADLFECRREGSGDTGAAATCAIAVDETHVYWRTCLDPSPSESRSLNGDILRIRR